MNLEINEYNFLVNLRVVFFKKIYNINGNGKK